MTNKMFVSVLLQFVATLEALEERPGRHNSCIVTQRFMAFLRKTSGAFIKSTFEGTFMHWLAYSPDLDYIL